MPTAGRVVGAMAFAMLVWFVSELFKPAMPEGTNFGRFSEYNAALGALLGWVMLGPRSHPTKNSSIGAGLTTMVAILFWATLIHGILEMLKLSLRNRYDGPVDAVVGVFQLMIKYGLLMATPEIIGTLVIGSLLAGGFSGWAERRWP